MGLHLIGPKAHTMFRAHVGFQKREVSSSSGLLIYTKKNRKRPIGILMTWQDLDGGSAGGRVSTEFLRR